MEYDKIIGIDPGASGGIAIYSKSGLGCSKMPMVEVHKNGHKRNRTDIEGLATIFADQKKDYRPIVFIEKVQAFGSDTDAPGKRFNIQKMLANYEALLTVIKMSGIPMIEVPPRTWQSYLGLVKKGVEKSQRKKIYQRAAQSYYPTTKATLWNSDAICLVQFGRMKNKFDPDWIKDQINEQEEQLIF
jgi:hypothetical protein